MSYPFRDEDKKNLLMTLLKVMGGRKVRVEFDGSGDSGTIENPILFDQESNPIDLTNATFDWYKASGKFEGGKWIHTVEPTPNMPVNDILIQITEDALEEEGLDWYNNEGGYGVLNIDLTTTPANITMSVSIRIVNTDDYEFDYTENLDDEQEGK